MAGYGNDTGAGWSFNVGVGKKLHNLKKNKSSKELIDVTQVVESTEVSLYSSSTTKAAATLPSTSVISLSNGGDSMLAVVLKLDTWNSDTTTTGTTYINQLLPAGQSLTYPASGMVVTSTAAFMDGTVQGQESYSDRDDSGSTTAGANLFVDSTINVDSGDLNNTTNPVTFGCGDGNFFRVGDLIRVENEIMEITGISSNNITVRRAVHGSTAASHSGTPDIEFPFFNCYHDYDAYATVCTDKDGKYKSKNFFGYGRGATALASGILPGSVTLKFYNSGYQDWGLSGVSAGTSSGLTKGSTYYFKIAVDGGSAYEVVLVVDSASNTFGGPNGIVNKINNIFKTQYDTVGSALYKVKVWCSMYNGDLRFSSGSKKSTSAISLTTGSTGSSSTNLIGNAIGIFPASVKGAISARLPDDTIHDSNSWQEVKNNSAFMKDDGNGSLIGYQGTGSINYETGEWNLRSYPDAEFVYSLNHSCGLAGQINADAGNVVKEIFVRSLSAKTSGLVNLKIRG